MIQVGSVLRMKRKNYVVVDLNGKVGLRKGEMIVKTFNSCEKMYNYYIRDNDFNVKILEG